MSQSLKLAKAKDEFKQFVRADRASQARNDGFDPIHKERVKVSLEDAVNAFLKLHSEYDEFRDDLLSSCESESFSFSKEKWTETEATIASLQH